MIQHAKSAFVCCGGPFDGGTTHLSVDGDRKSIVFTAGGQRGRYAGPLPVSSYNGKVARNKRALPATREPAP